MTGIASSIARARSSWSGGPCSGWICGPCDSGRRGSSGNGSWYGGRNPSTCSIDGISTSPAMCETKYPSCATICGSSTRGSSPIA